MINDSTGETLHRKAEVLIHTRLQESVGKMNFSVQTLWCFGSLWWNYQEKHSSQRHGAYTENHGGLFSDRVLQPGDRARHEERGNRSKRFPDLRLAQFTWLQ